MTRREAVRTLLLDWAWHTTMEINAVDVGGSEGTRRARQIRKAAFLGKDEAIGWIVCEKVIGSNQHRYRAVPREPTKQADLFGQR